MKIYMQYKISIEGLGTKQTDKKKTLPDLSGFNSSNNTFRMIFKRSFTKKIINTKKEIM